MSDEKIGLGRALKMMGVPVEEEGMMTTGSLYFQGAGERDGKKLMSVIGVIAFDPNHPVEGGHQYVLVGHDEYLMLALDQVIDHGDRFRGHGLAGIICEPIWRT
jgi:hypothetical protein